MTESASTTAPVWFIDAYPMGIRGRFSFVSEAPAPYWIRNTHVPGERREHQLYKNDWAISSVSRYIPENQLMHMRLNLLVDGKPVSGKAGAPVWSKDRKAFLATTQKGKSLDLSAFGFLSIRLPYGRSDVTIAEWALLIGGFVNGSVE